MNRFLPAAARFCAVLYLALCARDDIRYRSIRPLWAVILTVSAFLIRLPAAACVPSDAMGVLAGSGFLFLLSVAGRSSIGTGDCFVLLACGSLLGFTAELSCLFLGLLFCAAYSLILLLRKRVSRKDTLPFLPFLLAGHLAVFAGELFSSAAGSS